MGDYIERKAVLNAYDAVQRKNGPWRFETLIESVPAADVRPVVRGRWIKQDDDPLDGNFYCSACNSRIDIATGLETPIDRGLFFCPNCGADVRRGDDDGRD